MRVTSRHIILSPLIALMLGACSTEECLDNKNSLPLAGFYSSSAEPKEIAIDSISLTAIGQPGDSLILDNARGVSQTFLPFNIDKGETTFRLIYNFTAPREGMTPLYDDITFTYDIRPWFVSSACGAIYKYRVNGIRHTGLLIDSVTCPKGVIDNVAGQNIFIYFRVNEEEGGDE